ncbi:hypothetical protein ACLOJK_014590, partial [Asimina triloba]
PEWNGFLLLQLAGHRFSMARLRTLSESGMERTPEMETTPDLVEDEAAVSTLPLPSSCPFRSRHHGCRWNGRCLVEFQGRRILLSMFRCLLQLGQIGHRMMGCLAVTDEEEDDIAAHCLDCLKEMEVAVHLPGSDRPIAARWRWLSPAALGR